MSNAPNFRQSLGPLSVGNVVSAALRIYRDRFLVYYKLALLAYLWLLVPIYGWAKFAAISGLISRLVYREIIESPETVHEARRHVNPRLWTFFTTGLLLGLILFMATLGVGIVAVMIFAFLFATAFQNNSAIAIIIIALLALLAIILFIFGYIWLYSRLSLSELSIAIEEQPKEVKAISRSWHLTRGFVVYLQLIFLVAYLLTIPILLMFRIVDFVLEISIGSISVFIASIFAQDSLTYFFLLIYVLLAITIQFAAGALLIPFWQAIKAIIYYDLRTRKEGIDLQLRDSL